MAVGWKWIFQKKLDSDRDSDRDSGVNLRPESKKMELLNKLINIPTGQVFMNERVIPSVCSDEELQWAYENGAKDEQEALVLIQEDRKTKGI